MLKWHVVSAFIVSMKHMDLTINLKSFYLNISAYAEDGFGYIHDYCEEAMNFLNLGLSHRFIELPSSSESKKLQELKRNCTRHMMTRNMTIFVII